MWKLKPLGDGGQLHCLVAGGEYTVGRKSCAVLLHNDQSISRAHARLAVSLSASARPNVSTTFTVTDTSKYGTFVNGDRLAQNDARVLQNGDQLTFGVFENKFRVVFEALVVCSSCVDNVGKASLATNVQQLGGRLVSSWSQDCSHLVMPTVKVTVKTICALLCCRPIVKPDFFSELRKAAQQMQALPKAESFLPDLDEPTLEKKNVDLHLVAERKCLFEGKTFIFLNAKQLKRLSAAVGFGGGRAQLLEDGALPVGLLESAQSCVVDVSTGSSQVPQAENAVQWSESVTHILQRKGLRLIAESEIGLAAIYGSTKLYCNPSATLTAETAEVKAAIPGGSLTQSTAVDETVLPAASQNITAYAPDTETTQGFSRMDTSGPSAVRETPEKDRRQTWSSNRGSVVSNAANSCVRTEVLMSSHATGAKSRREGPVLGTTDDSRLMVKHPPSRNQHKSPQKQANSLTDYFKPLNKKRNREEGDSPRQSEAKQSRQEQEEQVEVMEVERSARQPSAPEPSVCTPASKGEGDKLGQDSDLDHSPGPSSHRPAVGKRKEIPATDLMEGCISEVDIEELESIMSTPMDEEDQQGAPTKRARLDPVRDIKEEEESLVEPARAGSTSIPKKPEAEAQPKAAPVKPELAELTAGIKADNGEDLPRNLLVIEFKSLLVDKLPRPRSERQQTGGKNFKKFRKIPVPGSSGLPKIIGGSDLVAHNRTKNSELEEWLRAAAEEESRNEREEALGDDLFRYNPRLSKRR
ncbi:nibrin [Brienomyrus brachyistius]|uniref:nibrin n=1 Tax=Brienomyrus brachyistius TaxID=42636 RepID=UPI0020B25504|nr:nibrin [Brienomyrus brachyistius]